MELPSSPSSVIFYWGCSARTDYRQMKGFLLQPAISSLPPSSSSSSLILHSSHWLSEQIYCSLLHKHSCYHLSLSLSALSIKVSTSLAIRVRHRLFDAKLAD